MRAKEHELWGAGSSDGGEPPPTDAAFRAFFEQGPYYAAILEPDGTVLDINRLALEACGYRHDEVVGRKFWACGWWHAEPDLVATVRRGVEDAGAGHRVQCETGYFRADGTRGEAILTLAPLLGADGTVTRLTATGVDISSRVHAETAARERSAQLALLADVSRRLVVAPQTDANVLRAVFSDLAAALGYELYFHYELGPDPRTLRLVASSGLTRDQRAAYATVRFGEYLCGRVAERREPLVAEDLAHTPYAEATALASTGVTCYAGLPLIAHGELLGTLAFATRRRTHLPDGHLPLIHSVCDQAAAQLARTRLEHHLRERETALSRAMEATRASEERLRYSLQAAAAGSWDWNIATGAIVWSPENYRLYDLEPTAGGPAYADWESRVHPDDLPVANRMVADVVAGRLPEFRIEFRVRHRDGRTLWLLGLGQVQRAADGTPVRMSGINIDISERKAAEARLRESEQRLTLALEASVTGIWDWNADTGEVSWSPECYSILGVSPAAGRGSLEDFRRRVHPDDRERMWQTVTAAVTRSASYACEFRIVRADDGETRWVSDRGRVVQREHRHLLGTITDVTEQRRAGEALRASEAGFRLLAQSVPAMVFVTDAAGEYVYTNDRFQQYTGRAAQALLGCGWLAALHPDDRDRAARLWTEAYTETKRYEAEYRLVGGDGQARWFLCQALPACDETGAVSRWFGTCTDIEDQKAVQAALRASEERLQLAMQAGRAGSWDLDLVTGRNVWSESHFTLLGLAPTADRVATDAMWRAGVVPEDLPRLEEAWHRARRERTVFRSEHRLRRADDGRTIWVDALGQFFYDDAGRAVRFVGVFFDITTRREAEDRLRQSEERFRAIFEHAATGIAISDWDGRLLTCNAAYAALLGEDAGALRHRSVVEFIHPEDRDENMHRLRALRRGELSTFDIENRYLRRDGEPVWVHKIVSVLHGAHGRPAQVVALVTDVTESRRTARQLAFLAELTAALGPLHASRDIAALAGARIARHFGANRVSFADVSPGEETATVFGGYHDPGLPDERGLRRFADLVIPAVLADLRAGRPVAVDDVSTDPRTAHCAGTHRCRGSGAVAFAPCVTEQRWAFLLALHKPGVWRWRADETALLAEVAARVYVRIERARAEEALRDQDRRKDEFLATLAHELRNPLAPIRNAAQVLGLSAPDAPELQWVRGVVDRQVQQMTRLIDDLLDVSRVSQGKLELRKETMDLARTVQAAVETSRPLADKSRHVLALSLPATPVWVHADGARITQVFTNLLDNAIKYTDAGGRIEVRLDPHEREAIVAVSDTGLGIPAEHLESIFEMFSQVDDSLHRAHGGLGIGLSLVKRLVAMHGGTIWAHSAGRGQGSTFVLRLPLAPAPAAAEPPVLTGVTASPSAYTILVVDDNPDAAASTTLLLKLMGNVVQVAHDGEEALRVAGECRPDVVLLDLGLPKLNGYDVCRRMRAETWGSHPVIIAVTGWGQAEDRRRTRAAGFDHHLVKPVDPAALLALLGRLVRSEG